MEVNNKKKAIESLGDKTRFDNSELEYLYEAFQSALSLDSNSVNFIEFENFAQCIWPVYVPEWKDIPSLVDEVFLAFDSNNAGKLDLKDFIFGMEKIRKDSMEDQLRFVFKLIAKDNTVDKTAFIKSR